MVSWFIVHCFRVSELCIEGSGSGVVVESCFVVFHLDVMCVHYFDCSCCLFVELVSCVDFVLLVVVSILWLSLGWLAGFIVLQVLCLIVCGRFHGLGVSCKQVSTVFWGL